MTLPAALQVIPGQYLQRVEVLLVWALHYPHSSRALASSSNDDNSDASTNSTILFKYIPQNKNAMEMETEGAMFASV